MLSAEEMQGVTEPRAKDFDGGAFALRMMRAGLVALGDRLLRIVSLGVASWLFALAVLDPDWRRILAASLFTLLAYLPTVFRRA